MFLTSSKLKLNIYHWNIIVTSARSEHVLMKRNPPGLEELCALVPFKHNPNVVNIFLSSWHNSSLTGYVVSMETRAQGLSGCGFFLPFPP